MAGEQNGEKQSVWKTPTSRWLLGIPLGGFIAFGLGAVALGTTNYILHKTGETEFCYTCHSHDAFIRPEYEASSHFQNAAGVRAGCSDCHLPHDNWFELVYTKMVVSLDIIPELMGKIDTAEKYEAHRAEMAEAVWRKFKANDSAFCQKCHSFDAMDLEAQERRTARRHSRAMEGSETCIDCHWGIVHKPPENAEDILERISGGGESDDEPASESADD
jgi:nitrate/TMAO reductase-like tetraheme cytochrome c subunit